MRLLVVDDSLTMRKLILNCLAELGDAQIDQAEDGLQCVAMAAKNAYDCILLDWNMPKMLGIDALKAIRSSGNKVPVMMVTTEAQKSSILEAIREGANNYVCKPFDKATLVNKIRQTVRPT